MEQPTTPPPTTIASGRRPLVCAPFPISILPRRRDLSNCRAVLRRDPELVKRPNVAYHRRTDAFGRGVPSL